MNEIPTDTTAVTKILAGLARQLEAMISRGDDLALVGIRSGGELVARSLLDMIERSCGKKVPLGVMDITLYRDDITRRRMYPEVKGTHIPFDVDDKDIVLVDDVLYTGRSARAAIDQIIDLGRPRRIYLLVLFDRGGRELPIQPDFTGMKIDLPRDQVIKIEGAPDAKTIARVVVSEERR
ncbi:MAG TPA: bifunctional pyr operon transcriptional regulator/uracil phosphoribosyltransferase PyrR [Deltaproteobacteria bacterium]|nr:bifunctional pyr operon transcriptional regulator/uracil phosphoribosyltransferase PyrR [Deltaproteobacteria bacterium]